MTTSPQSTSPRTWEDLAPATGPQYTSLLCLSLKNRTSSPLQVINFRGLVWTAGTVLPVLPIPGFEGYFLLNSTILLQWIDHPQVAIFTAVHEWTRANRSTVEDDTAASILSSVRLSLMSTPDLLKVVRPTGLVPADVLLDAIQSRTECRDMELQYRGYLRKYMYNIIC